MNNNKAKRIVYATHELKAVHDQCVKRDVVPVMVFGMSYEDDQTPTPTIFLTTGFTKDDLLPMIEKLLQMVHNEPQEIIRYGAPEPPTGPNPRDN